MALSPSEAVSKFSIPITAYKHIGTVQREFIKRSVNTGNVSLASTRLLSLMYDTHVGSLMDDAISKIEIGILSDSQLVDVVSVNDLFIELNPFANTIRSAVNEAAKFLPEPTVELLREYNTEGAPLERLAVGVFLVMATNLQV